jgi:predicted methyltransferase
MYGEKIENVGIGTISNDAVNLGQVTLSIENVIENNKVLVKELQNIVDNKIYIDSISTDSLSICNISQDDYHKLIVESNGSIPPNVLYVVSSDSLNMYGEKIENLADGIISSDAVNLKQLTSRITDF